MGEDRHSQAKKQRAQPDYRRSGHSVSLLYAHLVLVTKYRRRVFNNTMLTDCESNLREVCDALGAELVEFNGEADHVHLLVRYPPGPCRSANSYAS